MTRYMPAGGDNASSSNVQPSAFLPQSELAAPIIHPPGGGQVVGILGHHSTFKVTSEQTGGAYAVLEQLIPAGKGPPLHVHRHETEIFYVLEGEFEITVGEETVQAPAGSIATCPRDIPHTFKNVGAGLGKLLLTIVPGRFGNYFIEADGVRDHNRETIVQLCAKYDVEILDT